MLHREDMEDASVFLFLRRAKFNPRRSIQDGLPPHWPPGTTPGRFSAVWSHGASRLAKSSIGRSRLRQATTGLWMLLNVFESGDVLDIHMYAHRFARFSETEKWIETRSPSPLSRLDASNTGNSLHHAGTFLKKINKNLSIQLYNCPNSAIIFMMHTIPLYKYI